MAKKIATQEAEVERLSYKSSSKGGKSGGSGSKSTKDPYAEELKKRKELYAKYLKWVTSEDKTVRDAAPTEFAALLKGGTSYLDYLNKQRDSIDAKAKKTATDLKNLSTLNNEIAEATKESVLSDFDAQLNKELEQCKTVGEQLAVIAKKREELKNDNSDVDNAKKKRLDTKETDTKEQAKKETAELLKEYKEADKAKRKANRFFISMTSSGFAPEDMF